MIRSHGPRRSPFTPFAWAGLAALALVGLAQCRLVSDRITGIHAGTPRTLSMRRQCTHDCDDKSLAAVLAEAARFRAALRACGRNEACVQSERRAHVRRLRELAADRGRCKRACYNEGAGGSPT